MESSHSVKKAGSNDPTARDDKTENKIEAAIRDSIPVEERFTPDELQQQSYEMGDIDDGGIDPSLSRRVHILGFSAHARFVTHAVASTREVPVSIFAHHRKVLSRWGEESRRLSLYDDRGQYVSSAEIPYPERILDASEYLRYGDETEYFLDNLIVDTTSTAVISSITRLRHRMDRRTTICLLHPGLGLVEQINRYVFPDADERPSFVLGHSTHRVSKYSSKMYSMKQKQRGALYLYGVSKQEGSAIPNMSVAYEGMRQAQNLAQLLSSTETLNVVSLPWARFLWLKLPWLIFCSAADAISVIQGCKYKDISCNTHARNLWEDLLDETLTIVSQLPELQANPLKKDYFTGNAFRRKLRTFLVAQQANTSHWIKQIRVGDLPPVDYFNGYIVRRAEELGLDHKLNRMALEIVKARVSARRWELRHDLLGMTPYMTDTDLIGGGQPRPTPEELIEFELEDF